MNNDVEFTDIDAMTPQPARMYDYYLGGDANYPVDREAAAEVLRRAPEVVDMARANRDFIRRAVRFLAAEAGIRQFIDIGTGIPAEGGVHGVLGEVAPDAHIVYIDYDPIVNRYASQLVGDTEKTGIVLADVRDPAAIMSHPTTRRVIDFGEPVAVLMFAVLHFVTSAEDPGGIVATVRDALPPGSYLAISHITDDFRVETASEVVELYKNSRSGLILRSHAELMALLPGWDLVEPGLVQAPLWRPDGPLPGNLDKIWGYGGVARLG